MDFGLLEKRVRFAFIVLHKIRVHRKQAPRLQAIHVKGHKCSEQSANVVFYYIFIARKYESVMREDGENCCFKVNILFPYKSNLSLSLWKSGQ